MQSCTLALKLETANIKPVPEISWFSRDAPPRQLRPKPGQGEGGGVNVEIRGVNCWKPSSREVKVPFNCYHSPGASWKSAHDALTRNHLWIFYRPVGVTGKRLGSPEEIIGLFSPNSCRTQIHLFETLWQSDCRGKTWLPGEKWSRYQAKQFLTKIR